MAPKGGEGEALAEASSSVSEGRLVREVEAVPLCVAMPDTLASPVEVAEAEPLAAGDPLAQWLGGSLRWGDPVARALADVEKESWLTVARPLEEGCRL